MIRFFVTTFCILLARVILAQGIIEEAPLKSNPVLMEYTRAMHAEMDAAEKRLIKPIPPKGEARGNVNFEDTLYVVSGQKIDFDIDTINGGIDSIFLEEKSLLYGKTSNLLSIDFPRFSFLANSGITLGRDTVNIIIKYLNPKVKDERLQYWVIVKRANLNITLDETVIKAEKDAEICANTSRLTSKLVSTFFVESPNESIAFTRRKARSVLDTCIYYRASRMGGLDKSTVYVICDENQVCDTFNMPVRVLQDTMSAEKSEIFMDDFSYVGPYPNPVNWLDDRIYVNSTMSTKLPSVGIASFDGLNPFGRPYRATSASSDILTSAFLDLSQVSTNLFLSFYIEPKGYGYSPSPEDSFFVEIKNKDDKWVKLKTISTERRYAISENPPGFTFKVIQLPNIYFYKGVQIRFRALGSRTGIGDVWNLDYVRLSKENPGTVASNKDIPLKFSDIAFSSDAGSVLNNYTSMPWQHLRGFEAKELNQDLAFTVYNHFQEVKSIANSNAKVSEIKTGKLCYDNFAFFTGNVAPDWNNNNVKLVSAANTQFNAALQSIDPNQEQLVFVKELSLTAAGQDANYGSVLNNDKVTSTTVCSNYFAYDDGTAESVVSTQGTDSQIQVKFTANVDDSLRSILIHFPHFNKDITEQRFNLRVFIGSLGKTPQYEKLFLRPAYPDTYNDGFNQFTQYILTDDKENPKALAIPKGDFYIGWQQATAGDEPFVVGFDKNNPNASNNNFRNTTGTWTKLTSAKGAVMIRPKLSSNAKQFLSAQENTPLQINIFPNPAQDFLNIQIENANFADFNYSIFDISGRQVQQGIVTEVVDNQLLNSGFYTLIITDSKGKMAHRQKIAIIKNGY